MRESVFSWIRNIAYYMILVTAMLHVIPNNSYQKYVKLFTGMVLILLLSTPLLQLFGIFQEQKTVIYMEEYLEKIKEIEEETKYLEEIEVSDYLPEEGQHDHTEEIVVDKIEIGE